MTYLNAKPRHQELLNAIDGYLLNSNNSFSDDYKKYLESLCLKIDSICRKVLEIATAEVPKHIQAETIFSFSASAEVSPLASKIGDGTYRISMPVGLIQRLLESAPCAHLPVIGERSGIRESAVIYAALTAFAHEMNHLFIGHLEQPETRAQEFDSDIKAGMLVPVWAHIPDLELQLAPGLLADVYLESLMGFMLLCSLLAVASGSGGGIYLSSKLRFYTMVNGLVFACQHKLAEESAEEEVMVRLQILPTLFGHNQSALAIRELYGQVSVGLSTAEAQVMDQVVGEREREISSWYSSSKYTRPIARQLKTILKRDGCSPGVGRFIL